MEDSLPPGWRMSGYGSLIGWKALNQSLSNRQNLRLKKKSQNGAAGVAGWAAPSGNLLDSFFHLRGTQTNGQPASFADRMDSPQDGRVLQPLLAWMGRARPGLSSHVQSEGIKRSCGRRMGHVHTSTRGPALDKSPSNLYLGLCSSSRESSWKSPKTKRQRVPFAPFPSDPDPQSRQPHCPGLEFRVLPSKDRRKKACGPGVLGGDTQH